MARLLLILPTQTYRATPFVDAAVKLGLEVVIASEHPSSLARFMEGRYLTLDLGDLAGAGERVAAFAAERPIDAVVGADEAAVLVAAHLAARLGLRHSPEAAVAATRDKRRLRGRLEAAGVAQPRWAELSTAATDADLIAAAAVVGFPCVVKPVDLAASRGVIRADDPAGLRSAFDRLARLLATPELRRDGPTPVLLEGYVPGAEVAVEGLLDRGRLVVLAVFDKPDPLEGPFFEETLLITPSRHEVDVQEAIIAATEAAVAALGLSDGPLHAELRIAGGRPVVIEVAARSIGGLCSRILGFGPGRTLEEVILTQAMGFPDAHLGATRGASGVLMLPTPRAGVLAGVDGTADAEEVPGIEGVTVTVPPGERLVPLPEGDRYLGFVFARGASPADVEAALRAAQSRIAVRVTTGPGEGSGGRATGG